MVNIIKIQRSNNGYAYRRNRIGLGGGGGVVKSKNHNECNPPPKKQKRLSNE